jgi:hypothetical protein
VTAGIKEGRYAFSAVHVGEADAQYAKGVFDQFAIGPTQVFETVFAVLKFEAGNLAIQQTEERTEAVLMPGKFEL